MKHKDKRVLMVRDGKFHYWPAESQARREFQGWEKATPSQASKAGYSTSPDADETTTKTSEKGA